MRKIQELGCTPHDILKYFIISKGEVLFLFYIEECNGVVVSKGYTIDANKVLTEYQREVTKEEYDSIFSSVSVETINNQIVNKIREQYSIDDEFQMQRFGLQDSSNVEYQAYLQYVNECIAWGMAEKEQLGLISDASV